MHASLGTANGQSQTSRADNPSVFDRHGYALGFVLVFLAGLALNLTPCVYPLIGITIAYFGNQGGGTLRVAALATHARGGGSPITAAVA